MSLALIEPISTQRLTLRPVATADLADLFEVNGDPEVTRFLPYSTWQTMLDAEQWLERMKTIEALGTAQQLVISRRSDAKVLGTILLFRYEQASARFELGFALGRLYWQQGLMAEALEAVCNHAFSAMGIRRIEAEVNPANAASNRLLQKLGFSLEGRLRQRWVAKGLAYDSNFYGLLAQDRQDNKNAG